VTWRTRSAQLTGEVRASAPAWSAPQTVSKSTNGYFNAEPQVAVLPHGQEALAALGGWVRDDRNEAATARSVFARRFESRRAAFTAPAQVQGDPLPPMDREAAALLPNGAAIAVWSDGQRLRGVRSGP
jgi:hypothetical protein